MEPSGNIDFLVSPVLPANATQSWCDGDSGSGNGEKDGRKKIPTRGDIVRVLILLRHTERRQFTVPTFTNPLIRSTRSIIDWGKSVKLDMDMDQQ
jgi:hypothetical protein